ncbi:MAG: conserved phage C-terminal domain-containing protein [Gammaproteobacteria bacterium]|nr:conserved phage C-terminal domain-containing protein [Gammaproteobacteria bacterium]
MTWFKHDTNASVDAKLQTLMLDYGAAGYGLYWYCVELIAQGVSENNITFELEHDARIIARNLNLTVQETTDMMKHMIKLGLFSVSNEKLACYALAKRLDQSMTSNPKMRALISQIRQNHDGVMISHDKVMQEEKRREETREEEKRYIVEIVSYLNEKSNKNFKSNATNSKKHIQARLNEGYSVDDFKTVIDKKIKQWSKDTKMSAFIRPETLFGTKFDSYLNEIEAKSSFDLSGKDYSEKDF